ncbi:hypothetical protein ACFLYP_02375 [Chloroflexota bacterium]
MSFGLVLGAGIMVLGSGCALSGQCATCGACAAGVPLLAAPILIDGAIILADKVKDRKHPNQDEPNK